MQAHITLFYASLLGLLFIYLSYIVVTFRRRERVDIGMGESQGMARSVRAQGNFAEYVPLALILMLALENLQAAGFLVHLVGSLLLAGRILHAMSFPRKIGPSFGRIWGTAMTWASIVVASLGGIYYTVVAGLLLAFN
jgi:uncharacterized membrane protein YecN with MAPEG domain